MAVVINKVWSAFFNSNPASGSTNQSEDGSKFSVTLNNPLRLPESVVSCKMGVVSASIWNSSPNLSAAFNNNEFRFTVSSTQYLITIPDGLYSLSDLSAYLTSQFSIRGLSPPPFSFSANEPTGQVIITYRDATLSLDFTGNSVGVILGFPSATYPYPQATGGVLYSPAVAKLNRNNSYLIKTTLVSSGIPLNSSAQGIISSIPIPAGSVNSLIAYNPPQILWFDCSELIGSTKSNFSFELTNENLQPTPTSGNYYSFTVLIEYGVLLSNMDLPMKP